MSSLYLDTGRWNGGLLGQQGGLWTVPWCHLEKNPGGWRLGVSDLVKSKKFDLLEVSLNSQK